MKMKKCIFMPISSTKIKYLIVDEENASKEYANISKRFRNKTTKNMFKRMSEDEARHARNLENLEAHMCKRYE